MLKTLNGALFAGQMVLNFLLPHPASFQCLLSPFQFHLQKPDSLNIFLIGVGGELVVDVFGLVSDHESHLRLHHPHNLVYPVQLVLAVHLLPVEEVSAPDVSQEVVAN
jgi:hypothetical protein